MEKHRRANREHGADERRSKVMSSEDLGSKPHGRSSRELQHRHHKKSLEIASTQVVASQKLLNDILTNPRSGEDDYVRRWLAQTLEDPEPDAKRKQHAIFAAHERDDRGANTAQFTRNELIPENGSVPENIKPKIKRRRDSLSDSSILETRPRTKLQTSRRPDAEGEAIETERNRRPTPHKNRRAPSSNAGLTSRSTVSPRPRVETFEKRTRYKTREDRYDPQKDKHVKRGDEDKRRKKKKQAENQRKKASKKAGEDLMWKFSSKSVSQERLTIRPSHGLGLFNNGRASSPAKRRGLPDLAFSEMDFLQHSNRRQQAEAEQKAWLKSREKERRKMLRAQEEITEFFMPKRPPLREMETNARNHGFSKYREPEDSIFSRQAEQNQKEWAKNLPRSPSLEIWQDSYIGSKHTGHYSEKLSAPRHGSLTLSYSGPIPDSKSRISRGATSYTSWSETQQTPHVTGNCHMSIDRRHDSPTPNDVQRSIERTGIFRDTGILILDESRRSDASESPRATQARKIRQANRRNGSRHQRSELSEAAMMQSPANLSQSLESNSRVGHSQQDCISKSDSRPNISATASHPSAANTIEDMHFQGDDNHLSSRNELIVRKVHHCDPEKAGYGGRPRCTPAAIIVNRVELAKNARIRRLSSTLSVAQAPADHREGSGANQDTTPAASCQDKAANEEVTVEEVLQSAPVPRRERLQEELVQSKEQRLLSGHVSVGAAPGFTAAISAAIHEQAIASIMPSGGKDSTSPQFNPAGLGQRLQAPYSVGSIFVSGASNEAPSYLGLPLRGSSNGYGHSPTGPQSGLTRVTESESLFLHQLQRQTARENSTQYDHRSPFAYTDGTYVPLYGEENRRVEYYSDENTQENVTDYPVYDPSYDHIQYSPYSYNGELNQPNIQQIENSRTWHSQLERIDEQIEEYNDQTQDIDEEYHTAYESYNYEELLDPHMGADANNGYVDHVMEGLVGIGEFWRPRPQY